MSSFFLFSFFFFFNDTATTEIYTLSLHDALPISCPLCPLGDFAGSRGHGLFVCLQHSRGTASPGSRAKHSAFDRNGHAAGVGDSSAARHLERRPSWPLTRPPALMGNCGPSGYSRFGPCARSLGHCGEDGAPPDRRHGIAEFRKPFLPREDSRSAIAHGPAGCGTRAFRPAPACAPRAI